MLGILNNHEATSDEARESENTTSGLNSLMNRISKMICLRNMRIPNENPLVAAVILKSIVPSSLTRKFMGAAGNVGRA